MLNLVFTNILLNEHVNLSCLLKMSLWTTSQDTALVAEDTIIILNKI